MGKYNSNNEKKKEKFLKICRITLDKSCVICYTYRAVSAFAEIPYITKRTQMVMDAKISDFLKMQHDLAVEKGWTEDRTPEKAPFSILWSIDELGEAIAIIKKKGSEGIMENETVRAHFVEEIADTFMYLFDMMNAYGITAEEFSDAYISKFEKNMGRQWSENKIMYENSNTKLIIFDMEGSIVHETTAVPSAERLLETLSRTDIKLVLLSDFDTEKVLKILEENGLDSGVFHSIIKSQHYGEAFETAMTDFGVKPEEAMVCTGSNVALKIAQRLGMVPCAVKGRFSNAMYEKAGAKHIVSDIIEIEKVL